MNERSPRRLGLSRAGFLKATLATVGAGLGVVLLPAAAHAEGVTCCQDTTCGGCQKASNRYRCINHCTQSGFCACYPNKPQCFDVVCP